MLCTEHKINKKLCSCPEQKPSQVGVNFIALQQGDQIAEENHCEMGEMQDHEKIITITKNHDYDEMTECKMQNHEKIITIMRNHDHDEMTEGKIRNGSDLHGQCTDADLSLIHI